MNYGGKVEPFVDDPKNPAIVFDVRGADEYAAGNVKGAINIPHDEIASKIDKYVEDKNKVIILYCRSGRRSGIAKAALEAKGYTNVRNFGGYDQAKKTLANWRP